VDEWQELQVELLELLRIDIYTAEVLASLQVAVELILALDLQLVGTSHSYPALVELLDEGLIGFVQLLYLLHAALELLEGLDLDLDLQPTSL